MPEPKARRTKRASPRRRPVQDRSKDTVAAILAAAAQVLVRDGREKTTTNAIAERAGISVGTLYHYFANKAAVLEALTEQFIGNATSMFLAWRQTSIEERQARGEPGSLADLEQRGRFLFLATIGLIRSNSALARALLDEMPSATRAKITQRVEERIFRALPRAGDPILDSFRERDPKRYDVTVSLWITMAFAALTRIALDKPDGEEDELFVDVIVKSLVALIA